MSRFFKTSGIPLIDYSYDVPLAAIAAGLEGRQEAYNQTEGALDEFNALRESIKTLPDEINGQYIGDTAAGKELMSKYDNMINTAISKYDGDLSKMSGELRKIKAEAAKDFGSSGAATALQGRYEEYYKNIGELQKRREENKLNDADMYLATQGLNPFKTGEDINTSLGMKNFSNREDYNKAALEYISKIPEEKRTQFLRYDPSNPESMYGYIVEKTEEGKQFMAGLQKYLQNLPGFSSAMQRDLQYIELNPELKKANDEKLLKYRLENIQKINTDILKYQEMLKNPKAYGSTTEEINQIISMLSQNKDLLGDASNPEYLKDDVLNQHLYIQEKTNPFSEMEYKNTTYDLEQDWVTRANYEHSLALDRMKKQKELEEAANRTTFIGNGVIQENQITQELSDLPENIKKTEEQININRASLSEINDKMLTKPNPRDAVLNPGKYAIDVKNRKEQEASLQKVMTGRFNAIQNGNVQEYDAKLSGAQKQWVDTYYNDYIRTSMDLANNVVQKKQFEALSEQYFPKEVRETAAFNDAYQKYVNKYVAANPYNDRYSDPKARLKYAESQLSESEFYSKLMGEDKIPGIKDNKETRKSILNEAGIEDGGIQTKLAWNANLEKSIVQPASKIINASTLGSFNTTGGSNAGVIASDYFKGEPYTISVMPAISPSGSLDNVLQVVLTPTNKDSGKAPLPLAINPGEENAPVFTDMFTDIYKDGVAKGDQTLTNYGALGIFANTFRGQTTMALAEAAADKGLPIEMQVGVNTVVFSPTENTINGVRKYRAYFKDETGAPILNEKGEIAYFKDVNGFIQKDIMGMFTEVGKKIIK